MLQKGHTATIEMNKPERDAIDQILRRLGHGLCHRLNRIGRPFSLGRLRCEAEASRSEEVQGQDSPSLGPEELAPGVTISPGSRAEAASPQQGSDPRRRDPDAELGELAADPEASPPGILPPHPPDELPHLIGDRWPAAAGEAFVGSLPPHQLPVPAKERLGCDHERPRPPCSGEGPAQRGHEQPVAAAKMWAAHLALEDHQLVAKDHYLDFGVHQLDRRVSDQPNHVGEARDTREPRSRPNLLEKEARSYERPARGNDQWVCVPFRQRRRVMWDVDRP